MTHEKSRGISRVQRKSREHRRDNRYGEPAREMRFPHLRSHESAIHAGAIPGHEGVASRATGGSMRVFAIAVVLLLAAVPPSYADPYQLPSDEYRPDYFAGDANNLPVGTHLSKPQLIEWARRLPKVEVAMEEFARRGYIPRREGDDARQFSNPPMTTVALAYEKPGQMASDVHWAAPHILVVTSLSPTGEPSTNCTGRVLIYDSVQHLAFVGDSLAEYRASDPWFEVVDDGAGGIDDTNPKLRRATMNPRKPCWKDPNCWDPLIDFLVCAAGRTFAVESAALIALPAILPTTPVGWAVWAAGVGIGSLAANLLCLYEVFGHRSNH